MINWMRRRIERSRARCQRAARGQRRPKDSELQMLSVEPKETQTHRRGAEDAEGAQRVDV